MAKILKSAVCPNGLYEAMIAVAPSPPPWSKEQIQAILSSIHEPERNRFYLIDAAPELLEALRSFMSYGCPVCGGDCASANPPVMSCPVQLGYAAIAKAESHQPTQTEVRSYDR